MRTLQRLANNAQLVSGWSLVLPALTAHLGSTTCIICKVFPVGSIFSHHPASNCPNVFPAGLPNSVPLRLFSARHKSFTSMQHEHGENPETCQSQIPHSAFNIVHGLQLLPRGTCFIPNNAPIPPLATFLNRTT